MALVAKSWCTLFIFVCSLLKFSLLCQTRGAERGFDPINHHADVQTWAPESKVQLHFLDLVVMKWCWTCFPLSRGTLMLGDLTRSKDNCPIFMVLWTLGKASFSWTPGKLKRSMKLMKLLKNIAATPSQLVPGEAGSLWPGKDNEGRGSFSQSTRATNSYRFYRIMKQWNIMKHHETMKLGFPTPHTFDCSL